MRAKTGAKLRLSSVSMWLLFCVREIFPSYILNVIFVVIRCFRGVSPKALGLQWHAGSSLLVILHFLHLHKNWSQEFLADQAANYSKTFIISAKFCGNEPEEI